MFTITHNGRVFFDPRLQGYPVKLPRMTQEANRIGALTFTVMPGHPEYDEIDMLTSVFSVYRDGTLCLMARPIRRKRLHRGAVEYTCEEITGTLNDLSIRPFNRPSSVSSFLTFVLTNYNNRVSASKRIYAGHVYVETESSTEYKQDNCAGYWDTLINCLVSNHGGYLVPRYTTDKLYLDYVREEDLPMAGQKIQFGKNLADLFLETDSSEAFSVLVPQGAVVQNEVEVEPESEGDPTTVSVISYTSISAYNDGKDYLESAAGIELFGRREHVEHFDGVTDPLELKTLGQKYLDENAVKFAESVQLTAADLHNANANVPAFKFMYRVLAESPLLNLSHVYPIEKLDIPLGDPEDADISLGKPLELLSEKLAEYERAQDNFQNEYKFVVEGTGLYINKNGVWAFSEDVNNGLGAYFAVTKYRILATLADEINSLRSWLELTASHLQAQFDDYANSLRSYLELTASNLRTEFDDYAASLRSYLELTASHLRTEFDDYANSLRSYLELTASHLRTEFYDDVSSLRSYLELTASHLRTEFYDDVESLRSYVEITASHLQAEFADDVNSLRSYLEITASHLQTAFTDEVNSMRSYLELTASSLRLEFELEDLSLRSAIEANAEQIALKVSAGDVATQLAVEVGNVTITGGNLVVDGMITAQTLEAALAALQTVTVGGYLHVTGTAGFENGATFGDDVVAPEGQFTSLYFGTNGDYDAMDAVTSIGPASERSGQIIIPWSRFSGAQPDINFNIADTQFYQDGVSAAYQDGEDSVTITNLLRTNRGYDSANNQYFITARADASNGATLSNTLYVGAPTIQIVTPGTEIFTPADNEYFVPLTVTLSNGYSDSQLFVTVPGATIGIKQVDVVDAVRNGRIIDTTLGIELNNLEYYELHVNVPAL